MNDNIGRKITSLTLMTIMLTGGMTIAFLGFTPDAYAVNTNLLVSAENTGGYVDGAQIVEIVVIDDDLDAAASPDVTVGGDAVAMVRANDGSWYAYIADTSEVKAVDHGSDHDDDDTTDTIVSGIDFGEMLDTGCIDATTHTSDSIEIYCGDAATGTQKVPAAEKSSTVSNWPFIQTYEFSSTIEIQYNKAGGTQTTTLSFDSNADGLSLDRTIYPLGAQIHVTIGDHRLNIDPTRADVWTWNMAGDPGDKYYGEGAVTNDQDGNNTPDTTDQITGTTLTNQVCADCDIDITFDRQGVKDTVEIVEIDNRQLPYPTVVEFAEAARAIPDDPNTDADESRDEVLAATAQEWFTVREVGGPNTAVFSATTLADESILTVVDDAPRDSSAIITYDGTRTGILIKHSQATIEIQSPDDVWSSGLAIPIVVVDDDANKNSRADDDLSVSDINSIVPTLVTGDPFTLSEVSDEIVIWIGVVLDMTDNEVAGEYERLINSSQVDDYGTDYLQYSHDTYDDESVMFRLGAVKDNPSGVGVVDKTPGTTVDNVVGIRSASTIEEFSNRGIVKLIPLTDERYTDEVVESLEKLGIDNVDEIDANILVFDIADNIVELQNSLIDTSDDSNDIGFNMINYNFDVFEDAVPGTLLTIVDHNLLGGPSNQIRLGSTSGYTEFSTESGTVVTDMVSDYNDGDGFLQLAVHYGPNTISLKSGENYPVILDIFSFGFTNNGEASDERIANQIIRLELEENGSNTGSLEGTLEYVMINQLNINDLTTYENITPIGDEVSFIVIEDLTSGSAPSVTYLDVDTTGTQTQVSAQQDAPSHSAVVSLDVESFKTADTVTVTLEDLDLNTDSGLPDIYTVVTTDGDANRDAVGSASVVNGGTSVELDDRSQLGRMLDITFNDERWMTQMWLNTTASEYQNTECTNRLLEIDDEYRTGLGATIFSMVETGDATGIFVGTFQIPAEFCSAQGGNEPTSVTGLDIEVNYVDFRDASGETTEVGDSAGIKAHTGSVSLDRTVYPVPFGVVGDFEGSLSTTPSERNSETRSLFPIHQSGMSAEGDERTPGLDPGEFLSQGDLIVYVTVTDPDFDVSASGKDSIAIDGDAPVTVSVIRGSDTVMVAQVGDHDSPIDEIAPDAGIFESSVTIRYNDGPTSTLCPDTPIGFKINSSDYNTLIGNNYDGDDIGEREDARSDAIDAYSDLVRSSISGIDFDERVEYNVNHQSWETFYTDDTKDIVYHDGCILQGDILQVEYNDPTDASGKPNSVTDSATFDLRNGVLQSDKSVYIIGSDMILTLIEPDFDLDSSQDETYDLDLIKWSSSAATVTMGNADGDDIASAFDPEPLSFRETGPSTGIFQIVIEIPQELDNSFLQRGEEIDLEYTDWGPSGSDYVGDEDEDIRLTVFTSNFGATIDLDQKVYSWTDKVYITVVAPDHNFDNNLIDEIGESDDDPLRVATKGFDLDNYRLVETGFDTGIFTGEVILTGFEHDPSGDGIKHIPIETSGDGPTDGYLETPSDGGISVSYEFSEDETVFTSSIVRWNIGDVQWLEASYPASGTGVLRIIDPDMNLNPEAVDNLDVNIASHTDASGITLTVTETNEATGIFEGTVFFTTTGGSSGHRLRVSEGDTVTADYADGTLPLPYTTNDSVSITSTTIIGTIVPPLERAPATNLRIVDAFGSSIDAVSIDQQVQIVADLSNGQDRDQDFAYLIQIQDSDGVTVSLSWIAGSLSPGQSFSPSASWTPTSVGTYDVTAFVWESIDNPTALSPPLSIDVSVN